MRLARAGIQAQIGESQHLLALRDEPDLPRNRAPRRSTSTSTTGTGAVVCFVCGRPSASRISSMLPWSAVMTSGDPVPIAVRTSRPRQPSMISAAWTAAFQTPVLL